jgi:hypothetical protein
MEKNHQNLTEMLVEGFKELGLREKAEVISLLTKMMENQTLTEVLAKGFNDLGIGEKTEIISSRRNELSSIDSVDILKNLCNQGFYNVLPCLMAKEDSDEVFEIFCNYYGRYRRRRVHVYLYPNREEETELLKYAAKHVRYVKFLREETEFISNNSLRNVVFENASKEVFDYLIDWTIKYEGTRGGDLRAEFLVAKADTKQILHYIKNTYPIAGYCRIAKAIVKIVFARQDLNDDQKQKIIFEILIKVSEVYYRYGKEGIRL